MTENPNKHSAFDLENPAGIQTKFHVDDGNLIIQRTTDSQAVLDEAKRLRSEGMVKSESGDLHHVAKLSKGVIEKYCIEKGITFREFCINDEHVTRILNNPDYKLFRIWEGTV